MTKKKSTAKPAKAEKKGKRKAQKAKPVTALAIHPRAIIPYHLPPAKGAEMLELGLDAAIDHMRRKKIHHHILNPLRGEGG